jgi:hypothetical protein
MPVLGRIDAGYTYFGQFISHEIVPATHPRPDETRVASPWLDLDSLYGTEAEMPQYLGDDGLFPIAPSFAGGPDDLPRNAGQAHIPEPRNDENVIVSQLHLFLQRFHNYTIKEGLATGVLDARRLVTKVFQLLTVEDYLRQVLAPTVFDSYFRLDKRWLGFSPTSIPREFSHAAFRFGHSMVRASYEGIALMPDAKLAQLFRSGSNLDPAFVLSWPEFFGWPERLDLTQDASRIDPHITADMGQIPGGAGAPPIDIVLMNLRAGQAAQLPPGRTYVDQILSGPSGPAIAAALALAPLPDLGDLGNPDLEAAGIDIHTLPLWPYVLVEAMHASLGQHLGVLGSMICAEVLANAIAGAPHSIYQQGWRSVDDVLADLGPLGSRLQDERRKRCSPRFVTRTFCLRHLLALVLGEPAR